MKRITTIALLFLAWTDALPQGDQESKLQAAMLFNIIKYIQWPDESSSEKFVIGVTGSQEMYETLKATYEGKLKGTRKVTIQKFASLDGIVACSVLFVGREMVSDFDAVKGKLQGKNTLTVTYHDNLGRRGSCVNFVLVDGKIRFELNKNMLDNYNLRAASQLLSIATVI
jgi:hypothetical protein